MYPSHQLTNRMPPPQLMAHGFPPSYPQLSRSMSFPPYRPMSLSGMTGSFQPGYPLQVRNPLLRGFPQGFCPVLPVMPLPLPIPILPHIAFWEMEKCLSNSLMQTISNLSTQELYVYNGYVLQNFGSEVIYACNPLNYAFEPHCDYLQKYCSPKPILFLGMNPGRKGMIQTGVPFGDPSSVRNWLGITGNVYQLPYPPPRLEIQGLYCGTKEESGHRLWGLMKKKYGTAEDFSKNCFVHNYCPLLFLDKGGKNIPLDKIPPEDLEKIEEDCDEALQECIRIIQPSTIVGIGKYAHERIENAIETLKTTQPFQPYKQSVFIEKIHHPAPRTYLSAEEWEKLATLQLQESESPALQDF